MQLHAAMVVLWSWWRGSWIGRIAFFHLVWALFALRLMIGTPHPTGVERPVLLVDLIGYTVIAWVIASLPIWLRATGFKVWWAPRNSAGSMVRRVLALRFAGPPLGSRPPRATPRLSR